MTEKKHKKGTTHNEEVQETQAGVVAEAEVSGQVSAEIDALKKQVEEADAKVSEYKDSWQRSLADFQNYKRRIERDNEMMRFSMKGDIVKKVLPVLDDLERALQNRPADEPWVDGIELIVRKFQSILDSEGITKIEAEGAEFDPNFHEAISHEPSGDVASGHVIAIVQNGYMLGERVIRPALVRVAQ